MALATRVARAGCAGGCPPPPYMGILTPLIEPGYPRGAQLAQTNPRPPGASFTKRAHHPPIRSS
jgi:hypothetical protein